MKISADIFYKRAFSIIPVLLILSSCVSTGMLEGDYYRLPKSSKGIASWYGPDFHGRPTSSGEIFNMYAKTCAHREYPFGSILRVTNLSNKKSVDCIVNDRGPFVKGRDIDLSYGSAKEIGIIGQGVSEVMIEYIGRNISYITRVKTLAITGPYTLQIGSFREKENAQRLKNALEFKYRDVYIREYSVNDVVYYRVRIGKFMNMDDARELAGILSKEGYQVIIVQRDDSI